MYAISPKSCFGESLSFSLVGGTLPWAEKGNEEETKVLSKAKEREGEEGCEVCFPFSLHEEAEAGEKGKLTHKSRAGIAAA